jgi:adenylate kinase family enzyme
MVGTDSMKLAICGKMASGKTTLANYVCDTMGAEKFSLATGVKNFGNYLFDIPTGHKDRTAYQKVGEGGRQFLYPNIWIDILIKDIEQSSIETVVVDDVRYENEVIHLKEQGWKLIKLTITDELQLERLKNTYPNDWQTHAQSRNHASELEVDLIDDSIFDLIIDASDDSQVFQEIKRYLTD